MQGDKQTIDILYKNVSLENVWMTFMAKSKHLKIAEK